MSLQKLLKIIQDNPKLPFEVFPDERDEGESALLAVHTRTVASHILGVPDSFEEGDIPHFVEGIKCFHEGGFVAFVSAGWWCLRGVRMEIKGHTHAQELKCDARQTTVAISSSHMF